MRRWAEWLGTVLLIVAAVNFTTFFIAALTLGGDALHGKTEDGRYFLTRHGKDTEVSAAVWSYSRLHALSVLVTHPLGLIGGGLLLNCARSRYRSSARSRS